MEEKDFTQKAVIHIIVVGFHHKKGCQVEYSYPPLIDGEDHDSSNVPKEWKCLPFLALPDGAHNYDDDTIYFHLPPRAHYSVKTTVYGVSCYRQISTHLLKRKDDDVTRETVQKSVVVLSQMPIFGILHAKLQMITQAYFEEKDFAKNDILKELFVHVNMSISGTSMEDSRRFLGLSARSLVLKFQHKVLMLFKLILLERRIVFYASPVKKLVGGIMALLSLYPDMVERGLAQSTTTLHQHAESVSNELEINSEIPLTSSQITMLEDAIEDNDANDEIFVNVSMPTKAEIKDNEIVESDQSVQNPQDSNSSSEQQNNNMEEVKFDITNNDGVVLSTLSEDIDVLGQSSRHTSSSIWDVTSETALNIAASVTSKIENFSSVLTTTLYNDEDFEIFHRSESMSDIEDDDEDHKLTASFGNSRLEIKTDSPVKHDTNNHSVLSTNTSCFTEKHMTDLLKYDNYVSPLKTNEYGFPLSVFTRGHFCLPYVSLQQFNDLKDNLERGYAVGATNILFTTQLHVADVVIDIENANLEIRDNNLKRLLHLTAADLRFADNLLNNVSDNQVDDVFLDATGWEGGDEWIQTQFMDYLISMLSVSTAVNRNPKDSQDFNEAFLAAWKQTQNYKVWLAGNHPAMNNVSQSHPFQAQYSVSDVRLRIHHNLQSTDRGRKLEDAMFSANQAVTNTGKYMSTAFGSAKSSVSSWWSKKLKK